MSASDLKQRLVAILAADAAGYSRLMSLDERATVTALDASRSVFHVQTAAHQGRIVDTAGDSVLAVFETAAGALNAALQIQKELAETGRDIPVEHRMLFRVGIHSGDVMEKADGSVYGDGVNIAARLQALAEPGHITVSDAIHGAVRGKVAADFIDQGEQQVKNIVYPVRAFRVLAPGASVPDLSIGSTPERGRVATIMACSLVRSASTPGSEQLRMPEHPQVCATLVAEKVALLEGQTFRQVGGTTVVEFPGAVNALRCAAEIRSVLAVTEIDGETPRMRFGLHSAEVVQRGTTPVGEAVDVALALSQAAEPDSVLLSSTVFDQVHRNSPFTFVDLGERDIEKLASPVRVYRVRGEIGAFRMQSAPTKQRGGGEKRPSSIAVLPFRVTGGDEDQRFLADGITDELIVELGRFRRLYVISRSASFALSETTMDPVKIGSALGVRHLLEGQIRKIADRVRIGLTLTETDTGMVVWSDKIARPFAEMLDLLDEVTAKIAATVFGRIEDASMVATRRQSPENMTAFECLLQGMAHHRLGGVTDDHTVEAVKWFDKAIKADPNYAAAHAWRVCSASGLPNFDFLAGEKGVQRALELDPSDSEAMRIMASFELCNENHERAAALIRKAMESNPTDAYMKARCASISTYIGDAQQSLLLLDAAEALDPFLPVWCIEERGVALYALERYEEALQAHGTLAFQTWRSRLYRAAALMALDRTDEARKLVKEAQVGRPGLNAASFMFHERYRDLDKRRLLQERLELAGMPK